MSLHEVEHSCSGTSDFSLHQRLPHGPLFIFKDGAPLSRPLLVTHLREVLAKAGIDTAHYSGHSFRIGAASTAAEAGFSDSFIQTLGRWKSSAFMAYLRTPIHDLAAASTRLVGSPARINRGYH